MGISSLFIIDVNISFDFVVDYNVVDCNELSSVDRICSSDLSVDRQSPIFSQCWK